MGSLYCALVHHPVVDRRGDEVTTSVTNLDVHDIARSACTYGLSGYFVVSPIEAQHPVVQRIVDHWRSGAGKRRFPERGEALSLVRLCLSIEDAIAQIEAAEGETPRLVVTSAKPGPGRTRHAEEAARIGRELRPTLLLFGTGHGLSARGPLTHPGAEPLKSPVCSGSGRHHLRSAFGSEFAHQGPDLTVI